MIEYGLYSRLWGKGAAMFTAKYYGAIGGHITHTLLDQMIQRSRALKIYSKKFLIGLD